MLQALDLGSAHLLLQLDYQSGSDGLDDGGGSTLLPALVIFYVTVIFRRHIHDSTTTHNRWYGIVQDRALGH